MAGHARLLDRRRFDLLAGEGDRDATLAALDGHRNADGGYGWGLEPDLRSRSSQPGGALHAFEAFADAAPATSPHAVALCAWCVSATRPGGGLPFALPVPDPEGSAPFWVSADSDASSLLITAQVVAQAHRVAAFDQAVAEHPWVEQATAYCRSAIRDLQEAPHAIGLAASVRLAHRLGDEALLDVLARFVPAGGMVHVAGGRPDEYMRPLDFAPTPGPARRLFDDGVIEAELERLAGLQQDDGGWIVEFDSYSPAAALDWRGYATVDAVAILRANGVI